MEIEPKSEREKNEPEVTVKPESADKKSDDDMQKLLDELVAETKEPA